MSSLKQYAQVVTTKLKAIDVAGHFSKKRKLAAGNTSVAVELHEKGFAVAQVSLESDGIKIKQCQFIHNTNAKIRGELIAEMFSRLNISHENCRLVLSGNSYKFLLAEAPNAPLENLRAIMPSKIKDSLPWKVSDTTADVLLLPPDAFRGRKKSVYVAVAETKPLEQHLDLLHSVAIDPEAVVTVEMAIKGYWRIIRPPARTSIGVMRLSESGGVIVMICDGAIYLARRIAVSLSSLADEGVNRQEIFDQVVLEIQRSVDFYESQLGKGPVAKVVLLPPPIDLGIGFDYIEQNISTEIERMNPFEVLEFDQELSMKDQSYCISVLGAAIAGVEDV